MALPKNGLAWPPAELAQITPKLAEYGAWYSNATSTLADIYGAGKTRKGVLERIRTWFLGAKPNGQPDKATIHVSLAQEICRTAANLLFAEPSTATVEEGEKDAQARLNIIAGPAFEQTIVAAAEISAALGGVYLRAGWDSTVKDHAFVTKVDADAAWPTFAWGVLTGVTFWRVVKTENNTVWRHLEHHTVEEDIGVVYHGLYQGTKDNLGRLVPLIDQTATKELADEVDAEGRISTNTAGLAVAYAPNITPSALWRSDPIGSNLGRSDLEGVEQKLDALDELYSTWLRDIRLGKGRLIVGASMLQDLGAGLGAGFDLDQTIFTPVKAAPSSASDAKMAIEKVQFDIRTDDFMKAIDHFRRIILTAAGYSPMTFGMSDGAGSSGAITATEVAARSALSFTTRRRKILGLKPALEQILTKTLAIDAIMFPQGGAKTLPVSVAFPDGVQDDPEAVARQNSLDAASLSASIETRVRRANPSLDDVEVGLEVARIREDNQLPPLTDPETVGAGGVGVPGF
ncbi:phage portal protein [Arthrobacter sp. GMC3]|uniref:phage portal protein n=1 Tax=Arthrobacter sp. GMC3 TaxID=2058894 RepID=UPI000CE57666|nr:phage portal protein [Arthrobacter sp. GMC3]